MPHFSEFPQCGIIKSTLLSVLNIILNMQAYIPGRILSINSSVYLEKVMTVDQMNAAITFLSCKILPHRIINPSAVFWHVISLQSHRCTPQTKPPGSYFISSPVPVVTQTLVVF